MMLKKSGRAVTGRALICSDDPIFEKALRGPLLTRGVDVEFVEHPSDAVRSVMARAYDVVIFRHGHIGLNAREAAAVIKKLRPEERIFIIGEGCESTGEYIAVESPVDASEMLRWIDEAVSSRSCMY